MTIHANSIKTYYEEIGSLSKRASVILMKMKNEPSRLWTDRVMKETLSLPDMNNVRPRITELIKQGLVKEVGTTQCGITNKCVRVVRATTRTEWEGNGNNQTQLDL